MSDNIPDDVLAQCNNEVDDKLVAKGKANGKGRKKGTQSKKDSSLSYTMESTMRSVSLKFYDEQIVYGFGSDEQKSALSSLQKQLKEDLKVAETDAAKKSLNDAYNSAVTELGDSLLPLLKDRIEAVDNTKMEFFGICHDMDTLTNDFFLPAVEKRHYHVLGFSACGSGYKLRSWLKAVGIAFDKELDTKIVKSITLVEHKCEMINYLTHDTEKARKDGKYEYSDDKLFFNVSVCNLSAYRSRDNRGTTSDLSQEELVALDNRFYQLGHSAMPFDDSFHSLAPQFRKQAALKSLLLDSYHKGLFDNIQEEPEIDRLCIYIEGKGNTSKSYSARVAGKALYGSVFVVDGGRTGAFDDYQVDTKCLVINDYYFSNILNICDNKKAKLYRRQRNNPYCLAETIVVTGNKPFDDWLRDCSVTDRNQIKAMGTRFFVCKMERVEDYYQAVLVDKPSSIRGDYEAKCWRFIKFIDMFNESAKQYKPVDAPVLSVSLRMELDRVSHNGGFVSAEGVDIPQKFII